MNNTDINLNITLKNYDEVMEKLKELKKLLDEIKNLKIEVNIG